MKWQYKPLFKREIMIKLLYFFLLIPLFLTANDRIFECTKVFEERKNELILELERIDEQRQALDALKAASDDLLTRKETILNAKDANISKNLASIESKEQNIKKMLDENRQILEDINTQKMDAIAQTFSKMKPSAAAGVLAEMDVKEAVRILRVQKPKTIGKILTKMPVKKASDLTLELAKEIK